MNMLHKWHIFLKLPDSNCCSLALIDKRCIFCGGDWSTPALFCWRNIHVMSCWPDL